MSRSCSSLTIAIVVAVALIGVWRGAQWGARSANEPLEQTAGRLQLVLDDQDIGTVRQGAALEVRFAVANAGTEKLLLRQAPSESCPAELLTVFSVEPGQTGEIVARLTSDELLARGRKHIRFFTSDATNPELWVTVRGSVVRRPPMDDLD